MDSTDKKKTTRQSILSFFRYPVILLFFGFLLIFVLVDLFTPDKQTSVLENRTLTQAPVFETASFAGMPADFSDLNKKYTAFAKEWSRWTTSYGDYAKDQLIFRDEWVGAHSFLESAQGKLENGGVWFAKNGYLIAKNDVFSSIQANTLPVNITSVCELSERHKGKVSAMIIPSPANVLSDELRFSPPQIDENAMLDDIFTQFEDAGINVIDLRDNFAAHAQAGEELFYKTDHHWTTPGGAKIAYDAFCASKGIAAIMPPEQLLQAVPDFLGTNYSKSRRFGTTPEPLQYYDFPNTLTVFKLQNDDTVLEEPGPLMDTGKLSEYDKYGAFLRGNNGYSVLEGNGEGSILIIKDSYGNSFVPYLIESYGTIGIIDLRAWFSVDDIIEDNMYQDIVVLYSFDSFSSDAYVRRMATEMQG